MSSQDPIFIVGCPRSGTSLTAGIIAACGAFGGELMLPADQHNPKGYFENFILSEMFNQVLRKYQEISRLEVMLYPNRNVPFDVEHVRGYVQRILHDQGYKDGPWYFKYPNALMHLHSIALTFPNARWVVVKRAEEDIRASAVSSFFKVRSFQSVDIVGHFLRGLEQVKDIAPDHIEIWPFRLLAQGVEAFKPMIDSLGLKWNEDAVKAFADPSLVHHDAQRHLVRT